MAQSCSHMKQIKFKSTETDVCEECIKIGDTWVHLRLCLECGHVGCCDSSKNKHATKHFHRSKHPLIRSIEPGEAWIWCYVDETFAGRNCGVSVYLLFSQTKNQWMAVSHTASSIRFMPINMAITISMSPPATASSGTMISRAKS